MVLKHGVHWIHSAKMQARDAQIREDWVKAMETRLVREELDKCHRAEGVNHYENCKWLADLYLQKMRENKVSSRLLFHSPRPLCCSFVALEMSMFRLFHKCRFLLSTHSLLDSPGKLSNKYKNYQETFKTSLSWELNQLGCPHRTLEVTQSLVHPGCTQ